MGLPRRPLWVISGHFAMRERCLLYPQKRTCAAHKPMSAKCQKRTLRVSPQRSLISDEHGRSGQDNPDFSELTELRIDLD